MCKDAADETQDAQRCATMRTQKRADPGSKKCSRAQKMLPGTKKCADELYRTSSCRSSGVCSANRSREAKPDLFAKFGWQRLYTSPPGSAQHAIYLRKRLHRVGSRGGSRRPVILRPGRGVVGLGYLFEKAFLGRLNLPKKHFREG